MVARLLAPICLANSAYDMSFDFRYSDSLISAMYPNRKQEASGLYPNLYLGNISDLETIGVMKNNIRNIRKKLGMSMDAVASLSSTTRATIMKLEKGQMQLTTHWMEKIARALKCSPMELIFDITPPMVPVMGYVGAGAEVVPLDTEISPLEEVECPTGYLPENIVALRVKGDSMEPQMEDGWLIFYKRETDGVPSNCIGELCVVSLGNNGLLVKKVRHGSKLGHYHLYSKNPNRDPIIDAKLLWASKVIDIRPT